MFGNPINLEGTCCNMHRVHLTPPVVPGPQECGTKLVSKLSIQCRKYGKPWTGLLPRLSKTPADDLQTVVAVKALTLTSQGRWEVRV